MSHPHEHILITDGYVQKFRAAFPRIYGTNLYLQFYIYENDGKKLSRTEFRCSFSPRSCIIKFKTVEEKKNWQIDVESRFSISPGQPFFALVSKYFRRTGEIT